MIREALAAVARNESVGGFLGRAPIAKDVVKRVVGGETAESALAVAAGLADRGLFVSLERATPRLTEPDDADAVAAEYAALVDGIASSGLAGVCEVAVLPEALGLMVDADPMSALLRGTRLAAHAQEQGVALMLGMGPATDTTVSLMWADQFHADGLQVGVTLPAALRRTEADCGRLAGRRVRVVKGVRGGDPALVFGQPIEIDKAFVRCAKVLLRGDGDPSFATHDPRLIEIVQSLVGRYGRPRQSYEFALFMGRLEGAQERLLAEGERVRVYVPYGPEWFERLVAGLAEQPSTVAAALRSMLPGSA